MRSTGTLIALAKLTSPGTLLLVDSLALSLSPHGPTVVAVTGVYLTAMKFDSDEVANLGSASSTPYQTRPAIPVGGGDSSSSPTMSMATRKNRMARDVLGSVCDFRSLESIERVLWRT